MEVNETVVTESSSVGVQQVEQAPAVVVEEFSGKERDKWLAEETDFPPKQKLTEAESSPAEKEAKESDSPADKAAEKQPEVAEKPAESAPAEPPQEKREMTESEKRIKQLLADNKVLNQRLSQIEHAREKPQEQKAEQVPEKPDPEKYETLDEYFNALADWKVNVALTVERQRVEEEHRKAQTAEAEKSARDQWNTRITEARTKHADFDAVALDPELPVADGSAIDWWVMNSDKGAEVLYYYGQHREELVKLNAMGPVAAARELARVEAEIDKPVVPAQPRVPKAPPPPSEASTKGHADPVAAALAAGDFATYRRLKDAEERGSST